MSALGHQLPVAVTSTFLVPGGIEWLVFGEQNDGYAVSARPSAADQLSLRAVT